MIAQRIQNFLIDEKKAEKASRIYAHRLPKQPFVYLLLFNTG